MRADPATEKWLLLALTPGLGSNTARELLGQFGLPENIFARPRSELAKYAPRAFFEALESTELKRVVDSSLNWACKPGNSIVTLADASYPAMLLDIPDPPVLLYTRGRLDLLSRPALAVVGSRNATPQGVRDAERFARSFSEKGLTIVSGLALGIDAAAHRGGIGAEGSTIAVLGTGADVVYPKENAELGALIARDGLLISEFPLGAAPLAHNFPRRNRLISGLSLGCLVVEASVASGSLVTARTAAEQGREVFAMPGSIHSPLARGCHALIKSGAKLVESAEDVLVELPRFSRPNLGQSLDECVQDVDGRRGVATSALIEHMGPEPVGVDLLCFRSGLSAATVAAELLSLEISGLVVSMPGGLFQRLS